MTRRAQGKNSARSRMGTTMKQRPEARRCAAALLAAALAASSTAAVAQDRAGSGAGSDWTFTAAPYLWASGLDGTVGAFGIPAQSVDLSFGDIVEDLDFAFMAVAEARRGRFSIGVDLAYARLSDGVATPAGVVATSIDAKVTTFMGTVVAGYDLVPDSRTDVDLIAGARFWSVDNDLRVVGGPLGGRAFSDGDDWVDPVVGLKLRHSIDEKLYLAGWAMVGGFGAGSDSMWDVMGGVGYRVSDRVSLYFGYRAAGVDYSSGGFVYDVTQKGPIFGGVFRF